MVIGDLESTSYASPTYNAVPAFCNRDESTQQKRLTLELLHARLGHRRCRTILAAHEHKLWADSRICMSPEPHCLSCGIATVRSAPLNKEHHTAAERPGEYVFLDILHPVLATGLTPASTYAFYLIIVDAYSRYVLVYGHYGAFTLIFDVIFFRKRTLSIISRNAFFSSFIEHSFLCMSTYLVFTVVPHRT